MFRRLIAFFYATIIFFAEIFVAATKLLAWTALWALGGPVHAILNYLDTAWTKLVLKRYDRIAPVEGQRAAYPDHDGGLAAMVQI